MDKPTSSPGARQPVPDGLMTLRETAYYLREPVEEVFRGVMTGRLPVVWIGPLPYVDRAKVMR